MTTERKSLGEHFKESFQKSFDDAQTKRERKLRAKRVATERQLADQESRLRTMLASIAEGMEDVSRGDLAVEIDIWRELYDDWTRAR